MELESMSTLQRIFCIGFYALTTLSAVAEERPTVAVGAILPLTGDVATQGRGLKQGMELCVGGGTHVSIDLVVEDDRSMDRVVAVTAAKKLISAKRVGILLNAYVNTIAAIAPITEKAGVPSVVIWDSTRGLKDRGRSVFGIGYSTELAGEDMAEFAVSQLKRSNFAIISMADEWSQLISAAFSERLTKLGAKVVFASEVNPTQVDFRSILARAKQRGADALYVPLVGPGLLSVVRQARELKFSGDVLSGDALGAAEIKQIGVAAEGVYVTQIDLHDPSFRAAYVARYGEPELQGVNLGLAALGCDAMKMIDQVAGKILSQGRQVSAESIRQELPAFAFEGVQGHTVLGPERTVLRREPVLQVQAGQLVRMHGAS
jgi:branched-chain amino acid transport system substrate-binding protein